MEESDITFDDFSLEMEDFEYKRVKTFNRIFDIGEGGSFAQKPLVHNGIAYVGSMDHNVYAVDAKTGKLVWKFRTEGGILDSSAVIKDGTIYIGSYDQNLYAIDSMSGKLVWKFRTMGKIVSTAIVDDRNVYFGSSDHNVYCLNLKTGKFVWKFPTQGEVPSTPTIHEGKLFIGSYDHIFYCIDVKTSKLLWKFKTQGDIFSKLPLLVHKNVIYFPSFDNYLRAVDVNTGKLVWKFLTGKYGGMGSGPVMYKDMMYQVNREGVLFALTPDGKELWNFRINHAMANVVIHKDRIYFGTEEQNLYCIDLNGNVLWKFPTQGIMWWKPTIWNEKVYFTSWDCNMYCVDINTHELVWKFRSQGPPSYCPPPFENFELTVKRVTDDSVSLEDDGKKRYDMNITEEHEQDFYKSRITYQVNTQYASKGKYQIDSREEEF